MIKIFCSATQIRYTADHVHKFLKKINPDGSCQKISGYGIVGLVRFLEG